MGDSDLAARRTVPAAVLSAFDPAEQREPSQLLPGGQGTSVRVGDLVLKPDNDPAEVTWLAEVSQRITVQGFRLPRPVAASNGRLVVDGWSAVEYVTGQPVPDDERDPSAWAPVLSAGRALHYALRHETQPSFIETRIHRWATADRLAWNDGIGPPARGLKPRASAVLQRLAQMHREEGLADQVIHGDLSGNVLLADALPPAVIDVSAYWRPPAYADAVVVIDALLWWHTHEALIEVARPEDLSTSRWRSLLARALTFRLLSFDENAKARATDVDEELAQFETVAGCLGERE